MAKADIKGIAIMSVFRSPCNPIIVPKDVIPSRSDFEIVGVFNAGVADTAACFAELPLQDVLESLNL